MKRSARGKPEVPAPLPAALETWNLEWNTEARLWSFTDLAGGFQLLAKEPEASNSDGVATFCPKDPGLVLGLPGRRFQTVLCGFSSEKVQV